MQCASPQRSTAARSSRPLVVRLSRFHSGPWAGEWLVTTRYSNWEAYGKAQDAVAKDPEFAQVQVDGMKIAELQGRNIAVGIDL